MRQRKIACQSIVIPLARFIDSDQQPHRQELVHARRHITVPIQMQNPFTSTQG